MTNKSEMRPRLLNKRQAAAYCGISEQSFAAACPIPPVALGKGNRMTRFDLKALDKWIDSLAPSDATPERDWLESLDT
jgi:hypothetical protein